MIRLPAPEEKKLEKTPVKPKPQEKKGAKGKEQLQLPPRRRGASDSGVKLGLIFLVLV